MTQAALGVEIVGEIIRRDGQRIPVTDRAIPEHIKFLIEFILNENILNFNAHVRQKEDMYITLKHILNLE